MGLSFYDQKSMEETVGSLRFASRNENHLISGTGDIIDSAGQEKIDPINIQQRDRDDIQVIDS